MTPEVRTPEETKQLAIDRARAQIDRAEGIYKARNQIAFQVYRLDNESLFRLRDLLLKLSDDDFRAVFRFAEGLAEWPDPDASLPDVAKEQDQQA